MSKLFDTQSIVCHTSFKKCGTQKLLYSVKICPLLGISVLTSVHSIIQNPIIRSEFPLSFSKSFRHVAPPPQTMTQLVSERLTNSDCDKRGLYWIYRWSSQGRRGQIIWMDWCDWNYLCSHPITICLCYLYLHYSRIL